MRIYVCGSNISAYGRVMVNNMENSFKSEYMKKAKLSYPPPSMTIGITSACNNKCLFCSYHGEDARDSSEVYNIPFMLSVSDFRKIVDMAYQGGVKRVHVCGTGEPFLNPAVLEMLNYVIDTYQSVSFQTNFWKALFDKNNYLDEIVKRADYISYIATDVCSSLPEEHEYIKKGSRYNELLESLAYIAQNSSIKIYPFLILTRSNCRHIKGIIDDFLQRGIRNFQLNIGNLFSYDYSEFTSSDNVYISTDTEITEMLEKLVLYGKKNGIEVNIPLPADKRTQMCSVFWDKFQTWPVRGCESGRYGENMIPHACGAVVHGDITSLGYLFDYDSVMDAWNSEKLVEIRQNLLEGRYPSEYCKKCYCYHLEDSYFKQKVWNKK